MNCFEHQNQNLAEKHWFPKLFSIPALPPTPKNASRSLYISSVHLYLTTCGQTPWSCPEFLFFFSYPTSSLSVNPINSIFKCVQNLTTFYNYLSGQVIVISFLDYCNILVTGFPIFYPSPCSLFSTVWPGGEILSKAYTIIIHLCSNPSNGFHSHFE